MRKYVHHILLLFLFAGAAIYGHAAAGKPVSSITAQHFTDKKTSPPYAINNSSEIDVTFTFSVTAASQHTGIKKLPGYASIQQLVSLDKSPVTFSRDYRSGHPVHSLHLPLIFPYHYFW